MGSKYASTISHSLSRSLFHFHSLSVIVKELLYVNEQFKILTQIYFAFEQVIR